MTLFGTTLDAAAIASLAGLLTTLALWVFVLRGQRQHLRWFRNWEAVRKARRDAELAAERGDTPTDDKTRGPWG